MTHKEKAKELLQKQYHCSQAIVGAFAEDFGLDLKTAFKISTCFGGGMRQGGLCGCITASLIVLGMAYGFYDPNDKDLEIFGNKKTDEFIKKFTEKTGGNICCKDILGKDISIPEDLRFIRENGLILKRCPMPISISIDIIEQMFRNDEEDDFLNESSMAFVPDDEDVQSAVRKATKTLKFRRNVRNLILESERKIGFIQFDIKRFKIINDLYGESFGDEVLYYIKEKLKVLCNERQYFVNLRSDVFMVVTEYDDEKEISDFIKVLTDNIREVKDVKLQLTFGVYTVEDKNMELRQMEDRAAMARKTAKKNILTNVSFYENEFKELLYTRKFVEENMQAAILEKQFKMYLQPKYSISQNKIVGAEALVRWEHPERGMVYPNEFIPIIEENGFVRKVDYFIWEEACNFIKKCNQHNINDCPVSVNVSRLHLRDNEFMKVLFNLINKSKINKSLLELEITETVNDQQISQKAMMLKDAGFTLLMDDFGSGYSSLNILLETPFDVIKIDRKFMENMIVSEKGKLILEYVVSMANKLGLGLLAEGVETKEQVDLLRCIGCDTVQGYYYAKPMPEQEFFEMLKKEKNVM